MSLIHSLAREWVLSQARAKYDFNSFSGTRVGSVTGTRKICHYFILWHKSGFCRRPRKI